MERAARVASLGPRIAVLDASGLSEEERRREGARWADSALSEHASVAAFAKFSLSLLAVGAPPSLLRQAHEAACDEVDHARLSFAVAARYLGTKLGPGKLSLEGDGAPTSDLGALVVSTVTEGCIAETIAALTAEREASRTSIAVLGDLHRLIADDEARHADLAWQFVRFAVSVDPAMRALAEDVLAEHGGLGEWLSRPQVSALVAGTTSVTEIRRSVA